MVDYASITAFFIFIILVLALWLWATKLSKSKTTQNEKGEYSRQMETDIRLTYKRFKELYPYSTITYQEYKKLQREKAFKRAVGSKKIKRMVR